MCGKEKIQIIISKKKGGLRFLGNILKLGYRLNRRGVEGEAFKLWIYFDFGCRRVGYNNCHQKEKI